MLFAEFLSFISWQTQYGNHQRLNSEQIIQRMPNFDLLKSVEEDQTQMKVPSEILLPLPSEVSGSSQTRPPTYTTLRKFGYFTSN